MIEKILQKRYKITEYLGCGGMAEVYKAMDMLLEREVAVKILRPQFAEDENFINKFKREAQAAAALTDSNIVSIFDVGSEDNIYYIVMEYVAGSTLQKLIQAKAPFPYDEAIFIAKGIAKALAKAHARGIIHCDIKPHNILLDESGCPKVSDFGIARAISSTTVTFDGSILGSVHYLSPEQAKGENVTFSSDIYSLGVVLFEMLTGKLPFTGETPIAVAMQQVQARPPLLREYDEKIPAVLEAIVSKALAKEGEDRYANAEDFIKALETAELCIQDNIEMTVSDATAFLDKVVIEQSLAQKTNQKIKKFLPRNGSSKLTIAAILLVSLFFLTMFVTFSQFRMTNEVKVPILIGKSQAEATEILQGSNLKGNFKEDFDNNVPMGLVVLQEPEAGFVVKEGREIEVTISKGPQLISVPNFTGKELDKVYLELAQNFLRIGKVEEQEDPEKPAGIILAQNPSPPAQVGLNSYIDLVVSTQKAKSFTMPDLTGFTTSEARAKISSLGLRLHDIQDQYTANFPSGTVVSQNPAPGQEVNNNIPIVIVVARSLNEQAKQSIVEFVVPSGTQSQKVRIIVTDNRSRRTVYEETHNPGERIRQTVEGIGPMRVQFFSNSRLIEEKLI